MSDFYVKGKDGKFLPVNIKSIINKELENNLIIAKVGDAENPISGNDLDRIIKAFEQAKVLDGLKNTSVIVTSNSVEIGIISKKDIEDKYIYIQVKSGDNIANLDQHLQSIIKKMQGKQQTVVLPSPLKIKDYYVVLESLRRCQIRRDRKGRNKNI